MPSFKYSIMRYVNDIAKDEAINIGVIISEVNTKTYVGKLIKNVKQIKNIHKEANIEPIIDLIETWRGEHELESPLSDLSKSFQHQLQFTEPKTAVGTDIDEELNGLYEQCISIEKNFSKKQTEPTFKKMVGKAIHKNINLLGISKTNFRKDVIIGEARPHKIDFVFVNGQIRDLIQTIPITASRPIRSREKAALLALEYDYLREHLPYDAQFHIFVEEGTKLNNDIAKPITEYLETAGYDVRKYDDIPSCLVKIKERISR